MFKKLNQFSYFKIEFFCIILGLLICLNNSYKNISKFDKIELSGDGTKYHLMIKYDIYSTWEIADKIRSNLKDGDNFFEAIPDYKHQFLPSIIVGLYYYIIDENIFTNIDNQKLIKEKNYKIGLLHFQTILYFFSLLFLLFGINKTLKKDLNFSLIKKILIAFLCLEPTINQFHSYFSSESIFISLMIISMTILLLIPTKNNNYILIMLGILIGLLFLQKPVSFFLFVPIIIYIYLIKKNLKPVFFFVLGLSIVISGTAFNNYKKSGAIYLISSDHQYLSYYFYFAHIIYAKEHNLTEDKAKNILIEKEKKWMSENNINIINKSDLLKNIKYRNNEFIMLVLSNPIISSKLFIKKAIIGSLFAPKYVSHSFKIDKTSLEAKNNPKKYYNINLSFYFLYSFLIYIFIIIGIFSLIKKISKKNVNNFDFYLILNIIFVMYFTLVSGFWGNTKYFIPCIPSLSFFFSIGFSNLLTTINKKFSQINF